jgi:hypothetical protein
VTDTPDPDRLAVSAAEAFLQQLREDRAGIRGPAAVITARIRCNNHFRSWPLSIPRGVELDAAGRS